VSAGDRRPGSVPRAAATIRGGAALAAELWKAEANKRDNRSVGAYFSLGFQLGNILLFMIGANHDHISRPAHHHISGSAIRRSQSDDLFDFLQFRCKLIEAFV
jgi:hypothetical protein